MDTSDSEDYYESADEDFELDNKSKTTKEKPHEVEIINVNNIAHRDADENITSKDDKSGVKTVIEDGEIHHTDSSNKNETDKTVIAKVDHENNSANIRNITELKETQNNPQDTNNTVIKSNENSSSTIEKVVEKISKRKYVHKKVNSPTSDLDRSEKNNRSKIKDSSKRPTTSQSKDEGSNSKIIQTIDQCDKLNNQIETNKLSEFENPGARVLPDACDRVDNIKERPEVDIPPTKVENCEPDISNSKTPDFGVPSVKSDCESGINKSSKRPEFGIPPAKVVCWIPDEHKSRENKDNKTQIKSNQEAQGDWDDNWEWGEEKSKDNNLWADEEGWGLDDDLECTEPIIKQTESSTSLRTNKLQESNVTSKEEVEDNLWGHEDNWGIEDSDNKNIGNITESLDKLTVKSSSENSGWGGWGSWGITSVLSTAANLTSTVSQGLTNVLETGIGVPNPEDLARQHLEEKSKIKSTNIEATTEPEDKVAPVFGLENFVSKVSTITRLVESTSTKVISGGLDTLETIGKKTIQVLQENDPGLKKKCAFLKGDHNKPVLSQVLRDAKEKAEEENKERERQHFEKKANYETIFDDHQGLVHLEALEMLSKQCDIKLEMIISKTTDSDSLKDLHETLSQVRELCELPDDDDNDQDIDVHEVKEKIQNALNDINIPITYDKLIDLWKETLSWIDAVNFMDNSENSIHQNAIETLAKLTAIAVEQFHKAGELLLIKEHRSTADEADSLVQLTITLSEIIHMTSVKYCEKLKELSSDNGLITNVFLEATNSSTYIKDAFQLLIPVLLIGAV